MSEICGVRFFRENSVPPSVDQPPSQRGTAEIRVQSSQRQLKRHHDRTVIGEIRACAADEREPFQRRIDK